MEARLGAEKNGMKCPVSPFVGIGPKEYDGRVLSSGNLRGVFVLLMFTVACHGSSGPGRRTAERGNRLWNPQMLVDRELTVKAGDSAMREFSMSAARTVKLEASAAKSGHPFSVYVMRKSEWEAFRAHRDFMHVDAFQGTNVTTLAKTAGLDTGVWLVVVENPKDATDAVTVKVKVTVDPIE